MILLQTNRRCLNWKRIFLASAVETAERPLASGGYRSEIFTLRPCECEFMFAGDPPDGGPGTVPRPSTFPS